MMVISTTSYADFKTVVSTMRKVDELFYNQSANSNVNGAQVFMTVAYAFDYDRNQCVVFQIQQTGQFTPSDFPSAIQLSGHLMVSDVSSITGLF